MLIKRTLPLIALIMVLAVSACSPAPTRVTLEPTSASGEVPAPSGSQSSYPPPAQNVLPTSYPAAVPGAATEGTVTELWTMYPAVPEDSSMERGPFLIESAMLTQTAGNAASYDLSVEGSLPTPCHLPRVVVNQPDAQRVINVEAYSVAATGMVCADVIQPFAGIIATITGIPAGSYTVMINNEIEAGQITLP